MAAVGQIGDLAEAGAMLLEWSVVRVSCASG